MQVDRSQDRKKRYNINLRLWSDHVPIAPLLKRSNFEAEHCHRRGEVIVINGRSTDRVAPRHYAALQNFETIDVGSLSNWLADTQKKLEINDEISLGLKSGQIEGVVWIALFGDEAQPLPKIDELVIAKLVHHHVRVLIENYTDLDEEGLPRRTWLASSQ